MTETYGSKESSFDEERGSHFDLSYFLEIFKRRALYFAAPFLLILAIALPIIKAEPPIYRAEGEILLESPAIAPSLANLTISELASERFEAFRERITAAPSLLAVIEKFNLFPDMRQTYSNSQLVDLARASLQFKPVPAQIPSNNPAVAFTVSFDYEVPDVALAVTNELLTEILSEDASRRTTNATETTTILENEVKRLQEAHDTVIAEIVAKKLSPAASQQNDTGQVQTQMKVLADLQADLAEKSSVYSDEHPVVKELKKKIAALQRVIAVTSQTALKGEKPDVTLDVLQQQQSNIEKNLEDASDKLAAARLAENLERNQQAEHLQIIRTPELPHKPVGPDKKKFAAMALALAAIIGAGAVFAAEKLNGSIRRTSDLTGIIDKHLIVSIPYLLAPNEKQQRRRKIILQYVGLLTIVLAAGLITAIKTGTLDPGHLDQYRKVGFNMSFH